MPLRQQKLYDPEKFETSDSRISECIHIEWSAVRTTIML